MRETLSAVHVSTWVRETLSALHCDQEGEHMGDRDSLCTVHCDQEEREQGEHIEV